MHPHHHGSGSIQTQLASVPTFVDPNPGIGFDYYNTPSCQAVKPYLEADNEIILHMQVTDLCSFPGRLLKAMHACQNP